MGRILARGFAAAGHQVVVLSRAQDACQFPGKVVRWDGASQGDWQRELEGADAVINLAGRSVNCRYTPRNRQLIKQSRVMSSRAIGAALAACRQPPRVWLQASTATIYSHRYDAANDETSGILGGTEKNAPATWRFSIDVAKSWERAALETATKCTRLVLMRSAMVMSPDAGGVFDMLLWLVRLRLGGKQGDGRQYVSWIHEHDFFRAVCWLIEHELSGPVNLAAPHPLPNEQFMRVLRTAWANRDREPTTENTNSRRAVIGLPAPWWMLELGTWLLRSESELVLKSRRVAPGRLLEAGFDFEYPTWDGAAAELCARWPLPSGAQDTRRRTSAARLSRVLMPGS